MNNLLRAIALWGIGDSLWLAARPRAWVRFWSRGLERLGDHPGWARAVACLELGLCLYLLRRSQRER